MTDNALQTFEYYINKKTDSVAGGLVEACGSFEGQEMPKTFKAAEDVLKYVQTNAGQVGKNEP